MTGLLFILLTTARACLDTPPRARRRHHALVTRRWVARRFHRGDPSRYFAIIQSPVDETYWLLSKNGSYPNAAQKSSLNVWRGCDARLHCPHRPAVVARGGNEVHNYAVLSDAGKVWGVSGLTSQTRNTTWGLRSSSDDWLVDDRIPPLSSTHPGCIENRPRRPVCQYDGRFSLAKLRNATLIYARGNAHPIKRGRQVTVARLDDMKWGPLEPLVFNDAPPPFDVLHDPLQALEQADVYFGSVNPNPALRGTLLGLFPTALKSGQAAVLMGASCDGVHWGAPLELYASSHVAGEIADHAVDGLTVLGGDVLIHIHAGVPGAFAKTCAFQALHPKPGRKEHPYDRSWREPPSELVGLAIPLTKLGAWARRQLRGLEGCPHDR